MKTFLYIDDIDILSNGGSRQHIAAPLLPFSRLLMMVQHCALCIIIKIIIKIMMIMVIMMMIMMIMVHCALYIMIIMIMILWRKN